MLQGLLIRNYRIFESLKIDQLRRLNLIAGSNNSGKTSLLEGIFLLAGGRAELALNGHIARVDLNSEVRQVGDNFWMPFFNNLDMTKAIRIEGYSESLGTLALEITSDRNRTSEILVDSTDGISATNRPNKHKLVFSYEHASREPIKSHIQEAGTRITGEQPDLDIPYKAAIVLSRIPNGQEDAIRLANLRKQKRDHLLLEALRVIEPRLQSVEDNSASGTPLIWGDIGLPELVPLAVMGEGMSRLARLVLSISAVANGLVMIDEIENGIHHTLLPNLWRAVDSAAEQFNTQVFATTHSIECVWAAHEALDDEDFRLHRLEEIDNSVRCITYDPVAIEAALQHDLEVR